MNIIQFLLQFTKWLHLQPFYDDHDNAIIYAEAHKIEILQKLYDGLNSLSPYLHDTISYFKDQIDENILPLEIVMPVTKWTMVIVHEDGSIPTFALSERDLAFNAPIFKFGLLEIVFTINPIADFIFEDSEDLTYHLNGVTRKGYQFDPEYNLSLSRLFGDAGVMIAFIAITSMLSKMLGPRISGDFALRVATGVGSMSVRTQIDDVSDKVDNLDVTTNAIQASVLDEATGLARIASSSSTIISNIEELRSVVSSAESLEEIKTAILELSGKVGLKLLFV